MTPLNNIHPNELFRFMHVRGPRPFPAAQISLYFVNNPYERVSKTESKTPRNRITMLYPSLVRHIGGPNQLEKMLAVVADYKQSGEHVPHPDHYASRYADLTALLNWLDVNSSRASLEVVRQKCVELIARDLSAYVKSTTFKTAQCVFWDNLLANLFSPNDPLLMTLACKYLGGLHVVEIAAGKIESETSLEVAHIYRAKPLIPKWVFETFAGANAQSDEEVRDQDPDRRKDETLGTRFNEIDRAIAEVRALIRRREDTQRQELQRIISSTPAATRAAADHDVDRRTAELVRQNAALSELKSPFELAPNENGVLSRKSQDLKREFFPEDGTLNLDRFLETLLREATAIAAKLGSEGREYVARVGDSILSSKELCAPMIDRDPCAILPRKEFASRGSFINSALIGELLVTKQQLVKYNAGEVAHVEAVMQGLTKERTHRRLNRTETTSTFERESINESEREQATTERFQMEKETEKSVKQDFQIKTGSNYTNSYGLMTFEGTLDSSFAMSQTQSQQTATSFSKEVTNRALFRVKETVREMQTITVINEVEETSLHKLTNDTNDHINGVYCWLDKYYLNKIINYGARLMIEFTPPEPANNYIFRALTKPQTGMVVEKPTPPADLVGPDGKKLTGPDVLTDTNYPFWVAQYEAAHVAAPPQEYVTLTQAFKNAYTINQNSVGNFYESLTAKIDIPMGYEAVAANTNIDVFDMGSNGWIICFLGTVQFSGPGATSTFPLPHVQKELALSMITFIVTFVCNVTVITQRSPETYNNWQLDAYDKIIEAYNRKKQAYEEWLNAQYADTTFGFTGNGNNPEINRATEREELKKRCLELFTGQRFESFDAATNGIQNVSGYPEILFREAITEGNLVRFFEQAFEWEHMTYIFYPYFWGRKQYWRTIKNLEATNDPLFTKFLQAGYARVDVPVRPGFENYVLIFNLLGSFVSAFGCSWNFAPSMFGALGISNDFIPGIQDPTYMSVTQELIAASGLDEDNGTIIGHYVQKVPTNLVYVVPLNDAAGNPITPGSPLPGLPDNSADPDIQPYL